MLVASIATIGAAPLSVQQQGTGQAPGQRVTSSNIVDGEVRNDDLANDAVTTEKIRDGQVTNDDLADDAVTSDKIADDEVTSADVEDGTITSTDIAEGTLPPPNDGTPDDNSVTSVKIVDGQVTSADIGNGQVTTEDLASGATTPNVHKVVGDLVGVPPLSSRSSQAHCSSGEVATGGGFVTGGAANGEPAAEQIIVDSSQPLDPDLSGTPDGWIVIARNENLLGPRIALTAIAICMGPSPP